MNGLENGRCWLTRTRKRPRNMAINGNSLAAHIKFPMVKAGLVHAMRSDTSAGRAFSSRGERRAERQPVWKDTGGPDGAVVDVLVDLSNPGRWRTMSIAEHCRAKG